MVRIGSSMKLSKFREELREVVFVDSGARIPHLSNQQVLDRVIVYSQVNTALESELQCVLDQIDQHLLESSLIAMQKWQLAGVVHLQLLDEILVVFQRTQIV